MNNSESLIVKFSGDDNTIDAMLLAQTIESVNTLLNVSIKQFDPESSNKLILKETKHGCFEAFFQNIPAIGASLLSMPEAISSVSNLLNYVDFILRLNKKTPKSIQNNKEGAVVVNGDGNTINITNNTYNMYTNSESKKATIDLLKNLSKSDRQGDIELKTSERSVNINKSYGDGLSDKIFELEKNDSENETIINATLPIYKPDLQKNGPWAMIYNNNTIWMKIEDETFLNLVKERKFHFIYGDLLQCQLRIKYLKDLDANPIIGSEKYSIKKVLKKIDAKESTSLFE